MSLTDKLFESNNKKKSAKKNNFAGNPYVTNDNQVLDQASAKNWKKDYSAIIHKQRNKKTIYGSEGTNQIGLYEGDDLYKLFNENNVTKDQLRKASLNSNQDKVVPDHVWNKLQKKVVNRGGAVDFTEDVHDAIKLRDYDIQAWRIKKENGISYDNKAAKAEPIERDIKYIDPLKVNFKNPEETKAFVDNERKYYDKYVKDSYLKPYREIDDFETWLEGNVGQRVKEHEYMAKKYQQQKLEDKAYIFQPNTYGKEMKLTGAQTRIQKPPAPSEYMTAFKEAVQDVYQLDSTGKVTFASKEQFEEARNRVNQRLMNMIDSEVLSDKKNSYLWWQSPELTKDIWSHLQSRMSTDEGGTRTLKSLIGSPERAFVTELTGNYGYYAWSNIASFLGLKDQAVNGKMLQIMNDYIDFNNNFFSLRHLAGKKMDLSENAMADISGNLKHGFISAGKSLFAPVEAMLYGGIRKDKHLLKYKEIDNLDTKNALSMILDMEDENNREFMERINGTDEMLANFFFDEMPKLTVDILVGFKAAHAISNKVALNYGAGSNINVIKATNLALENAATMKAVQSNNKFQAVLQRIGSGIKGLAYSKASKPILFEDRLIPEVAGFYGGMAKNVGTATLGGALSYIYSMDPTFSPEKLAEQAKNMAMLAMAGEAFAYSLGNGLRTFEPFLRSLYKKFPSNTLFQQALQKNMFMANMIGQVAGGTAAAVTYQQGVPFWSPDFVTERALLDVISNVGIIAPGAARNYAFARKLGKANVHQITKGSKNTAKIVVNDEMLSNLIGVGKEDVTESTPGEIEGFVKAKTDIVGVKESKAPSRPQTEQSEAGMPGMTVKVPGVNSGRAWEVEMPINATRGEYLKNFAKFHKEELTVAGLLRAIDKSGEKTTYLTDLQRDLLAHINRLGVADMSIDVISMPEFEALVTKGESLKETRTPVGSGEALVTEAQGRQNLKDYIQNKWAKTGAYYDGDTGRMVVLDKPVGSANDLSSKMIMSLIMHEGNHAVIEPKYNSDSKVKETVDKFFKEILYKLKDENGELTKEGKDIIIDPQMAAEMEYAMQHPLELLAAMTEVDNKFGRYIRTVLYPEMHGMDKFWSLLKGQKPNAKIIAYEKIFEILDSTSTAEVKDNLKDAAETLAGKDTKKPNLLAMPEETLKSDSFKQWFGDWENDPDNASYFTRRNMGKSFSPEDPESMAPILLFHGTQTIDLGTSENPFRVKRGDRAAGENLAGIYLTTAPNYASKYATSGDRSDRRFKDKQTANVLPVYANIRNPIIVNKRNNTRLGPNDIVIRDRNWNDVPLPRTHFDNVFDPDVNFRLPEEMPIELQKKVENLAEEIEWKSYQIQMAIQNNQPEYFGDVPDISHIDAMKSKREVLVREREELLKPYYDTTDAPRFPSYFTQEHLDYYKALGYDGVIYNGGHEVIAFEPTQIKSALGNRGTFDPNNPSIMAMSEKSLEAEKIASSKHFMPEQSFNLSLMNNDEYQDYYTVAEQYHNDFLELMSRVENQDSDILNTQDANRETNDDNNFINNTYQEAGYKSASEFFKKNIGKPYHVVRNNIYKKLRSKYKKADKDYLMRKAKHIALRIENLEEVVPVSASQTKEGMTISQIGSRTNANGIHVKHYQGQPSYFNAWKRKMLSELPADMPELARKIITELLSSKIHVIQEYSYEREGGENRVHLNSIPEYNRDGGERFSSKLDPILFNGYYPVKTNELLQSDSLRELMRTSDKVDMTQEQRIVADALNEFGLKKYLKLESTWLGRKPKGIDEVIDQIDYEKVKEATKLSKGSRDKNMGLFKDETTDTIQEGLYDSLFRKIDDYYDASPSKNTLLDGLADFFAWSYDPGGASRNKDIVETNEGRRVMEAKYPNKYKNLAMANSTISFRTIEQFSDYTSYKRQTGETLKNGKPIYETVSVINEAGAIDNEFLQSRGLRWNGKEIVKRVAVIDDWLWMNEDTGETTLSWLKQLVNTKANDGGELTINRGWHAMMAKLMGSKYEDSVSIKYHGMSGDGIMEKTAGHLEEIDSYTEANHPEIAAFIKKNMYNVAQIAQGTSFKNKGYEKVRKIRALTEDGGYVIATHDGKWLYAIDKTGIENPDLFRQEREHVKRLLASNVIPESLIVEVPITGEYAQKFLYKSHPAELSQVPISIDSAPGFTKNSFFFRSNPRAYDRLNRFIDDAIDRSITNLEDVYLLREVMNREFENSLDNKKRVYSTITLKRAGNAIGLLERKILSEYSSQRGSEQKSSFIVNYDPEEALMLVKQAVNQDGYLLPEKIPTIMIALDNLIAGDWNTRDAGGPAAGVHTLLSYIAKDLVDDTILARVPGVNAVVQPHGADYQHLMRGMDKEIENEAVRLKRIYPNEGEKYTQSLDKFKQRLKEQAKAIQQEMFDENGEIRDNTTGVLVSQDIIDELNTYQRTINGKTIGLFGKIMLNQMPSAGIDSSEPATIVGILPGKGAIRMNKTMAADILGRDNDFDKVHLYVPPEEVWNHWVNMKTHEGSLTDMVQVFDKAEQLTDDLFGYYRKINSEYRLPPKEFDSRPQTAGFINRATDADTYIGESIGMRKILGYALQNMRHIATIEGDNQVYKFGIEVAFNPEADHLGYQGEVTLKFGPSQAKIINKMCQLGVDKYNPNHVDQVKAIVTCLIDEVTIDSENGQTKTWKPYYGDNKSSYADNYIYDQVLTYLLSQAKGGGKGSTEVLRKSDSWSKIEDSLSKFYQTLSEVKSESSTPLKAAKKIAGINFMQVLRDKESGRVNKFSNNGAELYALQLRNKLGNDLIEDTKKLADDFLNNSENAKHPLRPIMNGKALSVFAGRLYTLLARKINRSNPDNMYNVTRDQPLFRTYDIEAGKRIPHNFTQDNMERRAYVTFLNEIAGRYDYNPLEIKIAEMPSYDYYMKDGTIYAKSKTGKRIVAYTDPITGKEKDLSMVKLSDILEDNGTINVDYSKIAEWFSVPALQEGFVYNRIFGKANKDRLKTKMLVNMAELIAEKVDMPKEEIFSFLAFTPLHTQKALDNMYQSFGLAGGSLALNKQHFSKREFAEADANKIKKIYTAPAYLERLSDAKAVELFSERYQGNLMRILAEAKKNGIEPTLNGRKVLDIVKDKLDYIGVSNLDKFGTAKDYFFGMREESLVKPEHVNFRKIIPKTNWWRIPVMKYTGIKTQELATHDKIMKLIVDGKLDLRSFAKGSDTLSDIMEKNPDEIFEYLIKPILIDVFKEENIGDLSETQQEQLMDELLMLHSPDAIRKAELYYSSINGGAANVKAAKVMQLTELVRTIHRLRNKSRLDGHNRTNTFLHPYQSMRTEEILFDQSSELKAYKPEDVTLKVYAIKNGEVIGEAEHTVGTLINPATNAPYIAPLLPKGYVEFIKPLETIRRMIDRAQMVLSERLIDSGQLGDFKKSMVDDNGVTIDNTKSAYAAMQFIEKFPDLANIEYDVTTDMHGKDHEIIYKFNTGDGIEIVPESSINADNQNLANIIDELFARFKEWHLDSAQNEDMYNGDNLTIDYIDANEMSIKKALEYSVKMTGIVKQYGNKLLAIAKSIDYLQGEGRSEQGDNLREIANRFYNIKPEELFRITRTPMMSVESKLQLLDNILTEGKDEYQKYKQAKDRIKEADQEIGTMFQRVGLPYFKLNHVYKKTTKEILGPEDQAFYDIADQFQLGDDVNIMAMPKDTEFVRRDSLWFWQNLMDREYVENEMVTEETRRQVIEGIATDIVNQYLYAFRKSPTNTMPEGTVDENFVSKLEEEAMRQAEAAYPILLEKIEISNGDNSYWYNIAKETGLQGYNRRWKDLGGEEKRDMKKNAEIFVRKLVNRHSNQLLGRKSFYETNAYFGEEVLDIGNDVKDGFFSIKYSEPGEASKDLYLDDLLYSYTKMIGIDYAEAGFSIEHSPAKIVELLEHRVEEILSNTEDGVLTKYLNENNETNEEAFRTVVSNLNKTRHVGVFYGYGDKSEVPVTAMKELLKNNDRATFAREGTPIRVEFIDDNGKTQYAYGDLIGLQRRKLTVYKDYKEIAAEKESLPEAEWENIEKSSEQEHNVVAFYNPVENKLNSVNIDRIIRLDKGEIPKTSLGILAANKKHRVYKEYAPTILNAIKNAEMREKSVHKYEHTYDGKEDHYDEDGNPWYAEGTRAGQGQLAKRRFMDNDAIMDQPAVDKTLRMIEHDIKSRSDIEGMLRTAQELSMDVRISAEYLGMNNAIGLAASIAIGSPKSIRRNISKLIEKIFKFPLQNMYSAGLMDYRQSLRDTPFGSVFEILRLIKNINFIKIIKGDKTSLKEGDALTPLINSAFKAEHEITQADEMLKEAARSLDNTAVQDLKKSGISYGAIAKNKKALEIFYRTIDESMLDVEENEITKEHIDKLRETLASNARRGAEINFVKMPNGKLAPVVDGITYAEYMKFNLKLLNMIMHRMSFNGYFQNVEHMSTRITYDRAADYVSRIQDKIAKVQEGINDVSYKRKSDILMAEIQTVRAQKVIGYYDKQYQHRSFAGRHMTMFQSFHKERQLDQTKYFKERAGIEDLAITMMFNDKDFVNLLRSVSVPGILFGGSMIYSAKREIANQLPLLPLSMFLKGVPWLLRAGFLANIQGIIKGTFFEDMLDDALFSGSLLARAYHSLLNAGLNLFSYPGSIPDLPLVDQKLDKKGKPIKRAIDDYVWDTQDGMIGLENAIGDAMGLGPLQKSLLSPIIRYSWMGVHEMYRDAKYNIKPGDQKYIDEQTVRNFLNNFNLIMSVTGTKKIGEAILESSLETEEENNGTTKGPTFK